MLKLNRCKAADLNLNFGSVREIVSFNLLSVCYVNYEMKWRNLTEILIKYKEVNDYIILPQYLGFGLPTKVCKLDPVMKWDSCNVEKVAGWNLKIESWKRIEYTIPSPYCRGKYGRY